MIFNRYILPLKPPHKIIEGMQQMEPLRFVHITDTHVNAPGRAGLYQQDMGRKLRQVFAHVMNANVRPAFFVISGDLVHEGDADDYRYLRQLLEEEASAFHAPVLVCLGNHDHRGPFREGFLGEAPTEEPYYRSETIDGLRVILLHSQIESSPVGTIDEEQLNWLNDELKTPAALGSVIVLHHPLLPSLGFELDSFHLTNMDEVAKVIEGRDVIGILAGHIHTNRTGAFQGVICAASSGSAFALEMLRDQTVRFFDNSSYNLVTVFNGKMNVETVTIPGMQQELSRIPLSEFFG